MMEERHWSGLLADSEREEPLLLQMELVSRLLQGEPRRVAHPAVKRWIIKNAALVSEIASDKRCTWWKELQLLRAQDNERKWRQRWEGAHG